jgi:DNA-binding CsgD family transcriptional regulator/tetratricopeptide (TPR) repeat protein
MTPGQARFRGRRRERHQLDRLLDGVRDGNSAVLVIRGEPGIGKTALLHHWLGQTAGFRTARVTGVQSELELPFAALHQLCQPMLSDLSRLPEPQARALRVAFGVAAGGTPERLVVGLAVLTLLAEAAAERPLVCVVDDAQWLDEPTAQVLGFVSRRLLAEPILMLFAVRESGNTHLFTGLPELTLEGLDSEDAHALLSAAVPGHLDGRVRDRIVAETGGNPLGLLELPRSMTASELAGGFAVPSSQPLSGQLHDSYVRRVRALPEPTQRLMLLAAADPTGDATLLWRAAPSVDVGRDAAAPADHEQLLEIGSQVKFRHPLVRSAAYAAASVEDRNKAHLALAQATDAERDPERRVWHLAVAATAPDEGVATELERTATAAQARAGLAGAATFLERAFVLTVEQTRRVDRGLAAAAASIQAGDLVRARSLVAESAASDLDDLQQARVEQLKGQIEKAARPGGDVPLLLLEAARRLESLDVRLARETYLEAWWAALLAGRFATPGGDLLAISRAARSAPRPDVARPCDLMLDGMATMITEGRQAAASTLNTVIELYMNDQVSQDDWDRFGRGATCAAISLFDFPRYQALSDRQVARVRQSGALAQLALSLNFHANVAAWRGDLEAAAAVVAELRSVKEVTGIRMGAYGGRLLAAYRGRPDEVAAIDDEFAAPGDGFAADEASYATALLNNGLCRYAEAVAAARDSIPVWSYLRPFVLSELIEGAVRTEQPDLAHQALSDLTTLVLPGADGVVGLEARGRALLSDGEEAVRCYEEAIACLSRTPLRIELGRAHLLYGEWLRRDQQRLAARDQLRRAYELFTSAGADAFAERARTELLATGETVRRRDVTTQHDLTPQELHIARLARDGHSNPEIGAQLFISPRTVEWHLRKVFTKLDITSRGALRVVLPTAQGADQGRGRS